MQVTKRNGELEDYDVEKIHKVVDWATQDLAGVSLSDIEMNMNLSLREKISTQEIQELLIKSAYGLISESAPNYQYVAARLLNMSLRKDVWGHENTPPSLLHHLQINIDNGVYDPSILDKWDAASVKKLGSFIVHQRDNLFTYAGLQQMVDKYLVKNRSTNEIFETPQFAYMLIAMCLFHDIDEVKEAYDAFSTFKLNLPTPIVAGARTTIKQFASCVLVDVDDSLDSIFASAHAIGSYTARRGGIGINVGKIRPIKSPIRGGEVIHTGIIPYLKVFESTVKSTSQNGIRGGSATVYLPFWHYEIEDVLKLKNNAGTDETKVRKLDYAPQFCRLFYERVINNEDITLFSPAEAVGLYDAFGDNEKFEELYLKYENSRRLKFKKKIKARHLIEIYARERLETGRIYSMNIDTANEHGSWAVPVYMSNLCLSGDTELTVVSDGMMCEMSLEEVVSHFEAGKQLKVLSRNLENGTDIFSDITAAAMTNPNAEVLEITDTESGISITCTPEHQIYTKNRGYVMAQDLQESDELQIC